MEDRLTKLEELFLNQTHVVEQMSLEMFQQQKEIAQLKLNFEELKERMDSSGGDIGGNERPPHY